MCQAEGTRVDGQHHPESPTVKLGINILQPTVHSYYLLVHGQPNTKHCTVLWENSTVYMADFTPRYYLAALFDYFAMYFEVLVGGISEF